MQRRSFLTRMALCSILGVAALSLGGCGFHLRGLGDTTLTVDRLALDAADSPLTSVVRNALEQAGTQLDQDAALRLTLGSEDIQRRELGVGETGSREIEMTLRAPFAVQRREDAAYLIHQQQLEVTTTVNVQDSNLLARDDQIKEALKELRQRAAQQLLDRLRPLSVGGVE